MKKIVFITLVLIVINACHKHIEAGEYMVNITIKKPEVNQIVAVNSMMPIEILVTREHDQTIHHLTVEIINTTSQSSEKILSNMHFHESGQISYIKNDFMPAVKGNFKLIVTSTDDNYEQPNIKEVAFIVN